MQLRRTLTICFFVLSGVLRQSQLLAGDPAGAKPEPQRAKRIADKILAPDTPGDERERLVREAIELAPQIIAAMTTDLKAESRDQYDRIPWIWRVAISASRQNDAKQLLAILEVATPKADAPLVDWQAVVLGGGVINALSEKGLWPARRIDEVIGNDRQLAKRWRRALELSAAMADDEKVPAGTRYDALRMIALEGWDRRGRQLSKYLAEDVNEELQMGAVSGVSDIDSKPAVDALIASHGHLADNNRKLAWHALLRTDERAKQVLAAIEAGTIKRSDLPTDIVERLKGHASQPIRDAAEKLLSTNR